eukprot:1873475-Prymnesium_polylepis.1
MPPERQNAHCWCEVNVRRCNDGRCPIRTSRRISPDSVRKPFRSASGIDDPEDLGLSMTSRSPYPLGHASRCSACHPCQCAEPCFHVPSAVGVE